MPALYNLALQRLLPAAFAVVGAARADLTAEQFRESLHADLVKFSRTKPINEDVWRSFAENVHYVSTRDGEGYETLRHTLADLDVRAGTNGNRLFYLATPPSAYGPIIRPDQGAPPHRERERARRRGEAVRPRSRERGRAVAEAAGRLHRGRDLPDRPLPRQGDRPEHPRPALRERHLRADLEPPVRRSRADHGGRVARHRGARRVLRAGRRAARHRAEPPPAARRARRDGAARLVRRQGRARREAQGPARHPPDHPGGHRQQRRPRPVWSRLHRGRAGAGVSRGGRRRAGLEDRDVPRDPRVHRQLALGGHAVLRPHRKAPAEANDRDRDPVPRRAARGVLARGGRGHGAERARPADPARRGHLAEVRREGPGPGHPDPLGEHGLRLRRVVHGRRAGRVRDAHPRRAPRRRDALHAPGRGRAAVALRRPDRARLGRGQSDLPVYPAGTWGPTEADLLIARDGRTWRKP